MIQLVRLWCWRNWVCFKCLLFCLPVDWQAVRRRQLTILITPFIVSKSKQFLRWQKWTSSCWLPISYFLWRLPLWSPLFLRILAGTLQNVLYLAASAQLVEQQMLWAKWNWNNKPPDLLVVINLTQSHQRFCARRCAASHMFWNASLLLVWYSFKMLRCVFACAQLFFAYTIINRSDW